VNAVMNLRVPENAGNLLLATQLMVSRIELISIELLWLLLFALQSYC
jgi:hypothetical protein